MMKSRQRSVASIVRKLRKRNESTKRFTRMGKPKREKGERWQELKTSAHHFTALPRNGSKEVPCS